VKIDKKIEETEQLLKKLYQEKLLSTLKKGMYIYVQASDCTNKTVFLARMLDEYYWKIPTSEWNGWLKYSDDMLDAIIEKWYPEIGEVVIDISSPDLKIKKITKENQKKYKKMTDDGYCAPYICQNLDEYLL